MPVSISIHADVARATATLEGASRKQIPFATAQAVNDLAFQVQRAERAAITSIFAHPRPFTQRSVFVDRARKGAPSATVRVGDAQAKYLAPFEFGGRHALPGSGRTFLNPKGIRLDAFGQIRGKPSTIGDKPNVFVGDIHGVRGFWQRLPVTKTARRNAKRNGQPVLHHLKLLIRFGEDLPVHKRLGFEDRARQVVTANFAAAFDEAIARALASRRT
jgi:hypothetical protein